jgi:RNA methyltransferase, TrmH family
MTPKLIQSPQNPSFKKLQEIASNAKARREHGLAWIEGERLCKAALDGHSWVDSSRVIWVISDRHDPSALMRSIQIPAGRASIEPEVWLLSEGLFKTLTQIESPTGWGLLVPIRESAFDSMHIQSTGMAAHWVVADRIQDPGNLGSLIRSAAAAGIRQMICLKGAVDPWSPKVLRAAMGAHFVMDLIGGVESEALIQHSQRLGRRLMSTANRADAVSIYSSDWSIHNPMAWVFGQEGEGVSASILSVSQTVVIPQSEQVESLNVGVAAGICLFEMVRRKQSAA